MIKYFKNNFAQLALAFLLGGSAIGIFISYTSNEDSLKNELSQVKSELRASNREADKWEIRAIRAETAYDNK